MGPGAAARDAFEGAFFGDWMRLDEHDPGLPGTGEAIFPQCHCRLRLELKHDSDVLRRERKGTQKAVRLKRLKPGRRQSGGSIGQILLPATKTVLRIRFRNAGERRRSARPNGRSRSKLQWHQVNPGKNGMLTGPKIFKGAAARPGRRCGGYPDHGFAYFPTGSNLAGSGCHRTGKFCARMKEWERLQTQEHDSWDRLVSRLDAIR
jgi:hypothetical protein